MIPKIVFELDNNDGYVKIGVAQNEKHQWCFGFRYKYYDSTSQGGIQPCCFSSGGTHDTEVKAIVAAIDTIVEKRQLFRKIPTIKNKLRNFKNDTLFPQLKLF